MEKQTVTMTRLDFQAMFESVPRSSLVLTPDLIVVAVSEAYLRTTMRDREEIVGRSIFDILSDRRAAFTADGVSLLRASLERVLRDGVADVIQTQRYDARRSAGQGRLSQEKYWKLTQSPIVGADHNIMYIIHDVEDVTEFMQIKHRGVEQEKLTDALRVRADEMEAEGYNRAQELHQVTQENEQRMRHQFEELNTLYQTAPVGLCLVGTDLRYLRINESLAEMNGIAVADTVGRSIYDVIPDFADIHEPMFQSVITSGQPVVNVEVSAIMPHRPGIERSWITNYYPLRASDGSVAAVSVVVQEITDQKRTEQNIRMLNNALTRQVKDYKKAVQDLQQSRVELQDKIEDLEKFEQAVIGRELKMIKLEKEIEQLKAGRHASAGIDPGRLDPE